MVKTFRVTLAVTAVFALALLVSVVAALMATSAMRVIVPLNPGDVVMRSASSSDEERTALELIDQKQTERQAELEPVRL